MSQLHLVRLGPLARIAGFISADAVRYPRGTRVVVRTARGLETGEVLAPPDEGAVRIPSEGTILRRLTVEDELLEARLLKHRQAALDACARRIESLGLPVVLMDVEHLFDGKTLVFYFLGELSSDLDALVAELTETYEAKVQFRHFAETLQQGCGPGCGTDHAIGSGCGSCSTGCAIAHACSTAGRDDAHRASA